MSQEPITKDQEKYEDWLSDWIEELRQTFIEQYNQEAFTAYCKKMYENWKEVQG